MRTCAYRHSSLALCCEVFLSPVFLARRGARSEIEVLGKQVLCLSSTYIIHSVHRRDTFNVSTYTPHDPRSCSHASMFAAGPSKTWKVDAYPFFANLGGAMGHHAPARNKGPVQESRCLVQKRPGAYHTAGPCGSASPPRNLGSRRSLKYVHGVPPLQWHGQ